MENSEPKKKVTEQPVKREELMADKREGQEPGKVEGRKPALRDEVPHVVVRTPRLSMSLWSLQSRFGRRF